MPFQHLGLHSTLNKNLIALGYTEPTSIQAQAIPAIRSGEDLIATAQTGTGKTAAFVLPILEQWLAKPQKTTASLILTPTRELANQIYSVVRQLAMGTKLRVGLALGGAPMGPQLRALKEGANILVATPGRLLAFLNERSISLSELRTLVLDEADQMFDMGFLPDVKRIVGFLPKKRQTLLFSATMPPELEKIGRNLLHQPKEISVGVQGTAASTVTHTAYPVPTSRKFALLEHLLEEFEDPSVIIFTRTRHGAKQLARDLYESGHMVGELHSDRSHSQRERAMKGFRNRLYKMLVATNIAARGIDVRHITHVVNYDVPAAPEEYVHRIGRAGRAGDQGDAVVLVAPEEMGQLARIERKLGKAIPRRRIDGFDYGPTKSGKKPKKKFKGQDHFQKDRKKQPVGVGGPPPRERGHKKSRPAGKKGFKPR